MSGTITSADVVMLLSVRGVFSSMQRLESFSMDDIFDHDVVDFAEVQLGADGIGVAGWIPRTNRQTFHFLPTSPSINLFETWWAAQDISGDGLGGPGIYYASGILYYPALQRKYTMPQGTLTRGQAAPSAKKVLQPREFEITWMPRTQGQPAIFGTGL